MGLLSGILGNASEIRKKFQLQSCTMKNVPINLHLATGV